MLDTIHQEKWNFCLGLIHDNIGAERFNIWFKCVRALKFDENTDTLTLGLPSNYFFEKFEDDFCILILAALKHTYGRPIKIDYEVGLIAGDESSKVHLLSNGSHPNVNSKLARAQQAKADPQADRTGRNDLDPQLNYALSFENYCVGESNRLAYTIARHIADNPVNNHFNPFFLYGDVGVGKTHLTQAIGISIKDKFPGKRVLYTTARLFQHLYSKAAMTKTIPKFINFFLDIDVLLLDDLQELSGKLGSTNDALFPVFNHLHQNGKQLVFTCDRPPMELDGISDRLIDRFKWGITEKLPRPDRQLRKDILSFKARKNGLDLSEDVIDLIADNATESVRELEGIVLGLYTRAIMDNVSITRELAMEVMRNSIKRVDKKPINFDMIVETTAEIFHLNPDVIFSKSRMREIAEARQVIMYLAHKHTGLSSKAIGTRLNREHTTVLHGISSITDRMGIEQELSTMLVAIEEELLK